MPEQGLTEQWLTILRRRKWVVIHALIVVPIAALMLSLAQNKEYEATASLLFTSASAEAVIQGADPGVVDPTREAATNDQLVSLPAVAQETARLLRGRATAGDVASSVTIDSSGEADVVRITATTGSPGLSAAMANAYGRASIALRRQANQARIERAVRVLERNLAALTPADRAGSPGRTIASRLDELRLAASLQTGNAELVQRASPPSSASSPKIKRNVVLGVVLGAILGFLFAALLERLDRTLRDTEEIEQLAGLPILARVPKSKALAARSGDRMRPLDPAASHAFRTLRANLLSVNGRGELPSLLVISQEPNAGKSTVARELALMMAEIGDSVVLVEADLQKDDAAETRRNPNRSPYQLAPPSKYGLSSVLYGSSLERALISVPLVGESARGRQLTVLPAGPPAVNAAELIERDEMRALLRELELQFDTVIIDTPPLAVAPDALGLIPSVSGIVVVCGVGRSTREGVGELRNQLMLIGAAPLGIVANYAAPRHDDYRYYQSRRRAVAHS